MSVVTATSASGSGLRARRPLPLQCPACDRFLVHADDLDIHAAAQIVEQRAVAASDIHYTAHGRGSFRIKRSIVGNVPRHLWMEDQVAMESFENGAWISANPSGSGSRDRFTCHEPDQGRECVCANWCAPCRGRGGAGDVPASLFESAQDVFTLGRFARFLDAGAAGSGSRWRRSSSGIAAAVRRRRRKESPSARPRLRSSRALPGHLQDFESVPHSGSKRLRRNPLRRQKSSRSIRPLVEYPAAVRASGGYANGDDAQRGNRGLRGICPGRRAPERSRLVAESTRTVTRIDCSPPVRGGIRLPWRTRSSLAWELACRSPISSRKACPIGQLELAAAH